MRLHRSAGVFSPSPVFDLFKRKPAKPAAPSDARDVESREIAPAPGTPANEPAPAGPAEARNELHQPATSSQMAGYEETRDPTPVMDPAAALPVAPKRSWSERLKAGLGVSREKLSGAITGAFRRRVLDEQALDELESALLMADVGVEATAHLLEDLKARYRRAGADADPRALLRAAFADLIRPLEVDVAIPATRPFVIMLAGVNGAGKTTSIGKLAKWLQERRLTVLLAAGDTFRAAAREQLAAWGERNGVAVIQQAGGDPAAVMFDAVNAAKSRGIDVVLADTAGRLPTQANLMDELRKIRRVLGKAREGAPDETWLVLDANTGQNALAQVRAFDSAVKLTGLVLTKLDGSAKGGIVAAIARQHPVPLKFIGVGEGLDDL
ncbi:MAG TPA: signal recognition particle-docking protein FtsY, partial [Casimicrobiaceae bacterium]|nr:signal recognition particle-docking protein FtsY [Casimicrobiaceae bacterium]